jgi:hypothetical protein
VIYLTVSCEFFLNWKSIQLDLVLLAVNRRIASDPLVVQFAPRGCRVSPPPSDGSGAK